MKNFIMVYALFFSFNGFSETILKDKIQTVITKLEKIPNTGVGMVVIHKGKVVLKSGFGFADRETKRPVTPQTLFAIGSTSKAFTATSLLMMQDEGKLLLNNPVKNILPNFQLKDPVASELTNSYDLMSHHTGMPRHDAIWYYTPFTQQELISRMACLEPNPKEGMGFRGGFQYNNLMFMVAGTVLENVSGMTWENFVQQRIFNELSMTSTLTSVNQFRSDMDIAEPYAKEQKVPHYDIWNVKAAGAIYSNINDLEKWLRFLIAKGKTADGKVLLSEENFKHMVEVHTNIPRESGQVLGYGLGWMIDRTGGQNIMVHGGNIDGFTTLVSFYPEEEIGIAIVINQNGSDLDYDLMQEAYITLLDGDQTNQQLRTYLGKRHLNLNFRALKKYLHPDVKFIDETSTDANNELETWLGEYEHGCYGEMSIFKREGKYFFKYYKLEQELTPEFLKEFELIQVDGKIVGLAFNMDDNAPKIKFMRK